MELFYRKVGEGQPIVVLHGVFGSSDNLMTVSKSLAAEGFEVYLLDARNHGQSPHSDEFSYAVMAADLHEFLLKHNLTDATLIGHSMGGKVVMQYVMTYGHEGKLVLVDIAPKTYKPHHQHILAGLHAVPLATLQSRKEAEEAVLPFVPDFGERQFLLKNLYRTEEGKFAWRINLPVLAREIGQIGSELADKHPVQNEALFLRGSLSNYVKDTDIPTIEALFPRATLHTIEGGTHWLHATHPDEFVAEVVSFIQK